MKYWKFILILILGGALGFIGSHFYYKNHPITTTANCPSQNENIAIGESSQEECQKKVISHIPILMYHHIAQKIPADSYYVSPQIFDKQMEWLKDNDYQVITYDDFYQMLKEQKSIQVLIGLAEDLLILL